MSDRDFPVDDDLDEQDVEVSESGGLLFREYGSSTAWIFTPEPWHPTP